MLDSKLARMVLQELMDKMDGITRDGMKDSFVESDHQDSPADEPQTELDKHSPADMSEIMGDVKDGDKEPDEDDDLPSIDPVVMLAKRFHK